MEITEAFDTMVQLEALMSDCYLEISQICNDKSISKELVELSKEEIDHKNLLATGKNYLNEAPDVFSFDPDRASQLSLMQNRMARLIKDVHEKKIDLAEAINDAAVIERILERFHVHNIAEVKDMSLRRLFSTLSLGDKEHKKSLLRILKSLSSLK
jgi:rubrerythrin